LKIKILKKELTVLGQNLAHGLAKAAWPKGRNGLAGLGPRCGVSAHPWPVTTLNAAAAIISDDWV
jgi:hypothetical protein